MSAYIVALIDFHHRDWIEGYLPTTKEVLAKHGGRALATMTPVEKLEGTSPVPSNLVILEFPTMDAARAFHSDPEYKPMIALRDSGATSELFLVESLPPDRIRPLGTSPSS